MKAWDQQSALKNWELSATAEIWLQMPLFLDVRKNWELDWASVEAVIFAFAPKVRFLDTLGDTIRAAHKPFLLLLPTGAEITPCSARRPS